MLRKGLIRLFNDSRGGHKDIPCLHRRGFLKLAACTAGSLVAAPALARVATVRERTLSFYNLHTGESLRTVYWAPGEGYIPDSLEEISWILRDRRNDMIKLMDPDLMDLLYVLRLKLGTKKPLHVISGYRSPQTNAMLRRQGRGVAKNSFHIQGKAVDIRVPNLDLEQLHRAALSLKVGGVGYYPRSDFVHVDTGPVRSWG